MLSGLPQFARLARRLLQAIHRRAVCGGFVQQEMTPMMLNALTAARRPDKVILNRLPTPHKGNGRATNLEPVDNTRRQAQPRADVIVGKLLKELSW
jgi:hypothetical protein